MSNTRRTIWPLSVKTIALNNVTALPYAYTPHSITWTEGAEMGLEIYPSLFTYQPVGLFMHLIYTFNNTLPTADQVLQGIYVRDTSSSYIKAGGSTIEKYMPLGVPATSGVINISLDLSSLLTGQQTNVVFLHFDANVAASQTRGNNQDTVTLWKLDLIYQTTGIRNEK